MVDAKDLKGLEDLGKVTVPLVVKDKKTGESHEVANRRRQGVLVIKSKMTDEEKAKFENLPGAVVEVEGPKLKKKKEKERKLPDHIRTAFITINDKDKNSPISIKFRGDWVPSDINLAGKHLILDFQTFVRNRAMRGK